MISPLTMPSRPRVSRGSRSSWDDVDHALLTALRTPGLPGDLAAASGLPADLVAAQLDVYVRDGLAARIGLGGLHYQLSLKGWQRLFRFADASHERAA